MSATASSRKSSRKKWKRKNGISTAAKGARLLRPTGCGKAALQQPTRSMRHCSKHGAQLQHAVVGALAAHCRRGGGGSAP